MVSSWTWGVVAIGLVSVALTACQSANRSFAEPRGTIIALYSDPTEYSDQCSSNRSPDEIILSCYRLHDLSLNETLAGDTPPDQLSLWIESWNDPPGQDWIIVAHWSQPWGAAPEFNVVEVHNLPSDGSVFCVEPRKVTARAINAVREEYRELFSCDDSVDRLLRDNFRDPDAFE